MLLLSVTALALIAAAPLMRAFASAQSDTIVFAGATTTTTTTARAAAPVTGCRCVPAGTCIRLSGPGFDVRIVNLGADGGCPYGQEWCCGAATAELTASPKCGIVKITNSSAQPLGTAKYGSYPWQAALLTRENVYIGSGVLISPYYVLTAAHKVAPYSGRNFLIRLGDWDGQKTNEPYPHQDYTPAQIITHPSYDALNLRNDIAILRLDKSVPIAKSPNINTACLGKAVPASGTRCWVSGWGKNAFGPNGDYQSLLKEVDVPIVDQANCETRLRATRLGNFFNLDRTSFMCAGGEMEKDACTGDGGAPLVCATSSGQWEVIGLVAWGIGCAGTGIPGVYVNVPNYRPWILQQTGISQ